MQRGRVEPASDQQEQQADEFLVATFNIRNGLAFDGLNSWPLRRRHTARALARLDADVVGLQEVYGFQRSYLLRHNDRYRAVGKGRRNGRAGEQCPILVRRPIELLSDETRWFGDHPDQPGTRLPNASFPRLALSTQLLAGWLDDTLPSLVMGDFNTVEEDTAVFAPLIDAGFGFVPFDRGTSHQFRGGTDGPRLDHMLFRATASTRWGVVSSGVWSERTGRRLPSDHWPALARVKLADA